MARHAAPHYEGLVESLSKVWPRRNVYAGLRERGTDDGRHPAG